MIRKIIAAIFLLTIPFAAMAQMPENDIAITPYIPEGTLLPPDASSRLQNKMMQMVTQNHTGSISGDFILTANYAVIDKQITASVPAQYIIDVEFSFYVVALEERIIVKEFSQEVRGMGRTEQKAVINAINHLTSRSPQVRRQMTSAREKIVDYYAQRIPKLIAKAQSLSDRGEYEDALAVLTSIPECTDEYPMVAEKMTSFYVAMVDKYAVTALREARSKIAMRKYSEALDCLIAVDPMSTHFGESLTVVEEVKQTIDRREEEKLRLKLAALEKQRKEEISDPGEHIRKNEKIVSRRETLRKEHTESADSWLSRLSR